LVAKNDITGDAIQTKGSSAELEKNWDTIFPDREARLAEKRKADQEYWDKVKRETEARIKQSEKSIYKNEYYDLD
jgi:hypothetical protein